MFITKVKFIKQLENIPLRLSDTKTVLLTMNRKIRCSIIGQKPEKQIKNYFKTTFLSKKMPPNSISLFGGICIFKQPEL